MQSLYSGCEMQVFRGITERARTRSAITRAALCIGSCILLNGCAILGTPSRSDKAWLLDGSLVLSRPVPLVTKALASNTPTQSEQSSETPARAVSAEAPQAPSIIISREAKTLTAIRPGEAPLVLKTEGAQYLKEGSFSITQKQENPLWYAPKKYFTKRSLTVPEEGSRERFKRAALGSRTIFLNDQTPIHSGPVWMQEIGGLRVNPSEMSQIYSMISVGTRVEVR